MELKLAVSLTETKTIIECKQPQSSITITDTNKVDTAANQAAVYFLLKDNHIIAISDTSQEATSELPDFTKQITITSPWDIELGYLTQLFVEDALENGIKLAPPLKNTAKIPANAKKAVATYKDDVLLILERFGYPIQPKIEAAPVKAKPAKARHKWTKEVSQMEFFIDSRESTATVIWQKRNEMLLKAGAKMMATAPLNKDGSLGFSAKMGDKLRADYADKFKDFVTTEDMILKSVNEIGLFLYFAGTNSWLELKDANGKTIDAWTRID